MNIRRASCLRFATNDQNSAERAARTAREYAEAGFADEDIVWWQENSAEQSRLARYWIGRAESAALEDAP